MDSSQWDNPLLPLSLGMHQTPSLFAEMGAVQEVVVWSLLLPDLRTSMASCWELLRTHCRPIEPESAFSKLPGDL